MPLIIQGNKAQYTLKSENGQYYISYRDEKKNKDLPVNSARDPEKEVMRLLGKFELKNGLIALVQGACALGLIEKLVEQRIKHGGLIIVLESDARLAAALCENFGHLFKNTLLVFPGCGFDINDILEEIEIEKVEGYRAFTLQGAYKLDADYYAGGLEDFTKAFSSRVSDLFTRMEFEPRWIANALVNAGLLPAAVNAGALFGLGKNCHAALVSSGPSLREQITWLRQNREKLFVSCVDSAYRVLIRQNIVPDLVFSLDAQGYTLRHICGLSLGQNGEFNPDGELHNAQTWLYADIVANPQVTYRWQGPLSMGTTARYSGSYLQNEQNEQNGQTNNVENRVVTPGVDFIEKRLQTVLGDIQSGGSVATSLFDLLRQMQFKTITLLGQDMAFTDREIHTTGTHHTDIWLSKNTNRLNSIENINQSVFVKRKIQWEKTYNNKSVPVDYVLSLYRHWFEQAIEKVSIPVYLGQTKGALIQGAGWGFPQLDNEQKSDTAGARLRQLARQISQKNNKSNMVNSKELAQKVESMYKSILNSAYGEDTENEFSFLHRIGKKLKIKEARNKNKEEGVSFKEQIETERKAFWKLIQKKIALYEKARPLGRAW